MRFSVEAAALKRAFAMLNPVLPRRVGVPILENVLLRLDGDVLHIVTNDLDQGARLSCAVEGAESGVTTVSAMRLKAIADAAPAGAQIEVKAAGDAAQGVEVRCGRSRFRMAALPPQEFPDLPPVKGVGFGLDAGALALLLSAGVASSYEETRYYLNGIFLHHSGNQLCATATDGHRLAFIPSPLPEGAEAMADAPHSGGGYIVPNAAVKHLSAIVNDRPCRITLADNALEVALSKCGDFEAFTYRSKLIEGTFPDYTRVIPSRTGRSAPAVIDTARFRAALKRCSIALSAVESVRPNAAGKPKEFIALNFAENVLTIEASGDFGESASEEMDIEWTGPEMRVGFNWRYLDVTAEAVDCERMRFWPDATGPGRFEPEGEDGRLYVVMPARV